MLQVLLSMGIDRSETRTGLCDFSFPFTSMDLKPLAFMSRHIRPLGLLAYGKTTLSIKFPS